MYVRFVPVCEPFERHPGLASPRRVLRHGFKLRQRKVQKAIENGCTPVFSGQQIVMSESAATLLSRDFAPLRRVSAVAR